MDIAESVESLTSSQQVTNNLNNNDQDDEQGVNVTLPLTSRITRYIKQEYYRIRTNKRNDRSEAIQVTGINRYF